MSGEDELSYEHVPFKEGQDTGCYDELHEILSSATRDTGRMKPRVPTETYTKNDVRWSFARGIVFGVFGTCSAVIALLELATVIKELVK